MHISAAPPRAARYPAQGLPRAVRAASPPIDAATRMIEGNCSLAETTNTAHKETVAAGRPFSRVLAHNINALVASRRAEDRRKGLQERISDAITRFTGSLHFVYIHAALFGGWIIRNLGWIPAFPTFDPSFVALSDGCISRGDLPIHLRAH